MRAGRLTSRRFVGRLDELAELESALREASGGRPALVLLGGESGVGKTRLVRELEQRHSEQAVMLRGEAVAQADGELPYTPLVGALRPLVREGNAALGALGRGSRAALAALLPGLEEPDGAPDAERHGPSAQLRLFEALLELVELLSEERPVVLILEDMHWADRSTRAFVAFLARSLRQERVVVLLSYRSDELHRRHPLRPLLAELERLEHARRVELAPFDRDELAEALADILGDAPSDQLVERLFTRSEGNPLYIEELLAAGLDGRGSAPRSLRDAFMLRIERLSDTGQRAARAIAVGRALDEQTISEVTGIEEPALQEALREAVAEQVLVADAEGRMCFRHALLREALYDDLLPGERGELHIALACALEARVAVDDDRQAQLAAAIASHYAAAGDQPAALRATVQAALAARDVLAYGDAADLAERALELWPRVADAAQALPLDHVELYRLAATAHGVAGDRARAEVLLQSALSELDSGRDPRRYSDLLALLARVQWSLNRGMEGVQTAQVALSMLPAGEVTRERVSLLAWLARTRHLRGRYREALIEGEEALAAATAAGDRRSEGEVLNTLGMTQIVLGTTDEGIARLRRAIEIAREDDDIDGRATAYSNLADALYLAGRTEQALEIANEGLAGTPRRVSRAHEWMLLTVSHLSFEAGDWEAARARLEATPVHPVGLQLMFRQLREAELALGVGDDDVAARCLDEVEPLVAQSSEPQWIGAFGAILGELRWRQRDLDGARDAVAHALDRMELCTDDVMRIARVTAVGASVEADIAQRARDLRERADERAAIAQARLHMQRLRAAAREGGPVEGAWSAVGAAELARARGLNDPALWQAAASKWESVGRPFRVAIMRWRAAEAHVEAGDRSAAAVAAGDALGAAQRLGSRWLVEEVSALADRARLVMNGRAPVPTSLETNGSEDPFGLTPREHQVLALVAEGATNRQIGAALFMAEKTASVHVSRILRKLGVSSRTQAAAVAHRLRLG